MRCEKCGYEGKNKKIIVQDKEISLCSVCIKFAPSSPKDLEEYIKEKVDWKQLETFRKYSENRNLLGMQAKAKQGKIMSRPPFGYKIVNKELVINEEEKLKVEEIFRTFAETNISLNKLAKKFNFSVNGIKKILKNFTYIGKIKFKGQVIPGNQPSIISPDLFNKVQNKLEKLGI